MPTQATGRLVLLAYNARAVRAYDERPPDDTRYGVRLLTVLLLSQAIDSSRTRTHLTSIQHMLGWCPPWCLQHDEPALHILRCNTRESRMGVLCAL